jgi:hypothetical protein
MKDFNLEQEFKVSSIFDNESAQKLLEGKQNLKESIVKY